MHPNEVPRIDVEARGGKGVRFTVLCVLSITVSVSESVRKAPVFNAEKVGNGMWSSAIGSTWCGYRVRSGSERRYVACFAKTCAQRAFVFLLLDCTSRHAFPTASAYDMELYAQLVNVRNTQYICRGLHIRFSGC